MVSHEAITGSSERGMVLRSRKIILMVALATMITLIHMTPKLGCAAGLDGTHSPQMPQRHLMWLADRLAHVTERHRPPQESVPSEAPLLRRRLLIVSQKIEGTPYLAEVSAGDVKIDRGGARALVPQEPLDVVKVGSGFQKMSRKAMPQGVHRCLLLDPRFMKRGLEHPLDRKRRSRVQRNFGQERATPKAGRPYSRDAVSPGSAHPVRYSGLSALCLH